MQRKQTEETHSVDELMRKLALTLVKDFEENLDEPARYYKFEVALKTKNMARIREESPTPNYEDNNSYAFKADYQLQSLFKRYIHRKDVWSEEELVVKACESFLATQLRLANLGTSYLEDNTLKQVLDRAAGYLKSVLGRYDEKHHRSLCRHGSRASVGVPARLACEAQRWQVPISGSPEHIDWFHEEIVEQPQIMSYLGAQINEAVKNPKLLFYQPVSHLTMTLVPKSFKSLRSIVPNTTLGAYYTKGLGDYLTQRLQGAGYKISRLQPLHKSRARQASIFNHDVTLDLSAASDSITDAMVKRLFPEDWYKALAFGRIPKVQLPTGHCVEMETFCTMGIGFTFPLQTLVFLSLLKSVESLVYDPKYYGTKHDFGRITVYGDDMIFNKSMYRTVSLVFESIGLLVNVDKTFPDGLFRESCGGDYHCGVDVRPLQPRSMASHVGKLPYEAVLYKLINGILMRWSEYEVKRTLAFLSSELESLGAIKIVPADFPDDAGVKCNTLDEHSFLCHRRIVRPKSIGHGLFRFTYLTLTSEIRKEERHGPYLWAVLRDRNVGSYISSNHFDFTEPLQTPGTLLAQIERVTGVTDTATPLLISKTENVVTYAPRKPNGWVCFLRHTSTYVTISHTGRYTRHSGVSCFGTRRDVL